MARGPKKWNEETIARFLKEGRGQGEGANYRPWLGVGDFSSRGRCHRIFGLKTNRVHHLFSDVEYDLFLLLEWSADVVDIREQYPLDRDLTMEIAAAHGIRHPHYPGTHTPAVMTVDFLVTQLRAGQTTYSAFNAKRTEEAEDANSLEKLELHRLYWNGLDSPHHLVFHSETPTVHARNIEWIRGAQLSDGEIERYPGYFNEYANRMSDELTRSQRSESLSEYCAKFDIKCGLEAGTGLRVARLLMQSRVLMPDLSQPNLYDCPLPAFKVTARPGNLRLVGGL